MTSTFRFPPNVHRISYGDPVQMPVYLEGRWKNYASGAISPAETNITNAVFTINHPIDITALRSGLDVLLARHMVLSYVVNQYGGSYAFVKYDKKIDIMIVELDGGELMDDAAIKDIISRHIWRPFDLNVESMLRFIVFRVNESKYVIGIVVHHFIADGISIQLLFGELMACYYSIIAAIKPDLPEIKIGYLDYISFMNRWVRGEDAMCCAGYWRRILESAPNTRLLVKDDSCFGKAGAYRTKYFDCGDILTPLLENKARRMGVSQFIIILAATFMALRQLVNRDDLIVSMVSSGRGHPYLNNTIGGLNTNVPLRVDVGGALNHQSIIRKVNSAVVEALRHQFYPPELALTEIYRGSDSPAIPIINYIQIPSAVVNPGYNEPNYITQFLLDKPQPGESIASQSHSHYLQLNNDGVRLSGCIVYHELIYTDEVVAAFVEDFQKSLWESVEE